MRAVYFDHKLFDYKNTKEKLVVVPLSFLSEFLNKTKARFTDSKSFVDIPEKVESDNSHGSIKWKLSKKDILSSIKTAEEERRDGKLTSWTDFKKELCIE